MGMTTDTDFRGAFSKALRRMDKALGAVTVAQSMAEPRTAEAYQLTAAIYLLSLTFDHVEAAAGGLTARIGGEDAKAAWMKGEFRAGYDAALSVMTEFIRTLEMSEDEDEREVAVDKIFTERDRLTAARPCCKIMGVCGE